MGDVSLVPSSDNAPATNKPLAFLRLPPELLIRIFKFAASTSLKCALALALVSSWVHALAEPHLFCTLDYRLTGIPWDHMDSHLGKVHKYRDRICNIWMRNAKSNFPAKAGNIVSFAAKETIFRDFVLQLAAEEQDPVHGLHIFIHGRCRLWSEIRSLFANFELPIAAKVFNVVTHLRFQRRHIFPRLSDMWATFPHLTHFAIPFTFWLPNEKRKPFEFYEDAVIALPRSLQLFVLVLYNESEMHSQGFVSWMNRIRKRDQRVFFALEVLADTQKEWKKEVEEGESFWMKAVDQTRMWGIRIDESSNF